MLKAMPILLAATTLLAGAMPSYAQPIDIGSRLELMVDDYLIDQISGAAAFQLHHPTPQEIVMTHDAPWEGTGCGYNTIFQDGGRCRMYYKAWCLDPQQGKLNIPHDTFGAYAESTDGIHWTKPQLGLFEFQGSKANNILWMGKGSHDFTPFKDTNPACPPGEQYKAVGYGSDPHGLYAFKSADGIHWDFLQEQPIITEGAFDTQNLAFWDETQSHYRVYIRTFEDGVRSIRVCTSQDFRTWTQPILVQYPGAANEALYTNQIKPYHRAPHIYIGFPTRYVERKWVPMMDQLPNPDHRKIRASSSERYGTAITEALFMSSRDGQTFKRWPEAFLRPGIERPDQWAYGDNYIAWHLIETPSSLPGAPNELSLFATESYWTMPCSRLRRYTLRIDGFVSISAPMSGGEFTTKPIIFQGKDLALNFSSSVAGGIRIEIQDAEGKPIPGFTLDEAIDIFGDTLDRTVPWKDGANLAQFAGKPIRLHFLLKDADLYAFQFKP